MDAIFSLTKYAAVETKFYVHSVFFLFVLSDLSVRFSVTATLVSKHEKVNRNASS